MRPIAALCWFMLLLAVACSPAHRVRKVLRKSPVLNGHFAGFALYDPVAGKMLAERNADKYFTPASNTKLFTLYTSLNVLGDSVPALRYAVVGDTLFFRGTGDPSLLHPDLRTAGVAGWLASRPETLVYVQERQPVPHFGPGWGWDDYNDYYSAEKAALPVYGNVARFSREALGLLRVQPGYFRSGVTSGPANGTGHAPFLRHPEHNRFTYFPGASGQPFTQDVPFRYSVPLAARLLSDTLKREVGWTDYRALPNARVLYGMPTDSLYRKLMQESDNFIAEQLLLMCSARLFDSLHTESVIRYAGERLLGDLPDKPVWVDGSGLSRYNLVTPRSLVALLHKLYRQVPQERLFALLPAGGRNGTLRNWYAADPPFVFAKTGSLSNVYCLSGYVLTRKGKVLLFSTMHNNYTVPLNDVRREIDKVLRLVAQD